MWVSSHLLPLISNAGYAPLHFLNKSDHRAIILDINLYDVLDKDLVSIKNHTERKLSISMPHRMKSYVSYVSQQWKYHNIQNRAQALNHPDIDFLDPANVMKLNTLDTQISKIMNSGEKKCSRVPSGSCIEWSPKLHEAIENVRTYQYDLRCLSRVNLATTTIHTMTFSEAISALRKAEEEYQTIKKNYKSERKKHLKQLAAFYVKNKTHKGIQSEIKRILGVEKQKQTATRINFALQRNRKAGINGILIPDVT